MKTKKVKRILKIANEYLYEYEKKQLAVGLINQTLNKLSKV